MDYPRTISSGYHDEHNNDNRNDTVTDIRDPIPNTGSGEDVIAAPLAAASITNEDEPAQIPPEQNDVQNMSDDEEDDYEYEDDDDAAFAGFLVDHPNLHTIDDNTKPAEIIDEDEEDRKKKWREPSAQAVNMSLRAEQETNGGKRRLALDLYRIMNQDTQEAGFSLQPTNDDAMDKWTIRLFQFDPDSNLAKDLVVLGLDHVQLEMSFPEQYPFEPPFVRVVRPRFKRQTGFVMNGALCMELLTKDGWNPINDIESVIVSVRSLLVVGDGRLEAACNLPETKYSAILAASQATAGQDNDDPASKRQRKNSAGDVTVRPSNQGGIYSVSEAQAAYSHLSDYHKKKGWDTSGWWARKG